MYIRIFGGLDRGGQWGLGQDARLVEKALRYAAAQLRGSSTIQLRIEHCDPVTWGGRTEPADLQIHLEIPCRLAMPWASFNVAVVNPEWWVLHSWDWCFRPVAEGGMDRIIFKSAAAADLFPEVPKARRLIVSWWTDMTYSSGNFRDKEDRFLYIVGGSKSKASAAASLVAAWLPEWPPLEIWCPSVTAADLRPLVPVGASVIFQTDYKTKAEKDERQRACKWHVVASAAEGFGYTMAEAVACGAPVLWTDLPIYVDTWGVSTGRIATTMDPSGAGVYREDRRRFDAAAVHSAVSELIAVDSTDIMLLQRHYADRMQRCRASFLDGWSRVLGLKRQSGLSPTAYLPTATAAVADERIGILTVTKDRKGWWPNMLANVTRQKWPVDKVLWILVDDGGLRSEVAKLEDSKDIHILHMTVSEPASIGLKRNRGVAAAPADITRFFCMDDDDHYPAESVGRRMPWLGPIGPSIGPIGPSIGTIGPSIGTIGPGQKNYGAVFCSTLPMYDVTRYISAMNVPPLTLGVAERVSEASLAFTRDFWLARPFPDISMAEGEGFLVGREHEAVEIPPYGIIVSFIHGANASGRRVPADQEPNGCHYGFKDEYFRYIHGLVTE